MTTPNTSGNEGQHSGGGLRLALCGYCQTWVSKPCGEGCCAQPSDPTWDQLIARKDAAVEGAAADARLYNAARDLLAACLKVRRVNARAACEGYLKPEEWGDELFACNADLSAAIALALGTAPGSVGGGDVSARNQPCGSPERSHDNHSFDGKEGA